MTPESASAPSELGPYCTTTWKARQPCTGPDAVNGGAHQCAIKHRNRGEGATVLYHRCWVCNRWRVERRASS